MKVEVTEPDSGINGDLSMIDASIVDTDFLSEYCRDGLHARDNKKANRISSLSTDKSVVSESEYSDAELFKMTGKDRRKMEREPLNQCAAEAGCSNAEMMKAKEKERYLDEFDRLNGASSSGAQSNDADYHKMKEKERYLDEFDRLTQATPETNLLADEPEKESMKKILNRLSADCESLKTPSVNNLNKLDSCHSSSSSLNANLKYCPNLLNHEYHEIDPEVPDHVYEEIGPKTRGSLPSLENKEPKPESTVVEMDNDRDSAIFLRSMPNLSSESSNSSDDDTLERVRKAMAARSDEALITIARGGKKEVQRMNSDSTVQPSSNRFTTSNC